MYCVVRFHVRNETLRACKREMPRVICISIVIVCVYAYEWPELYF